DEFVQLVDTPTKRKQPVLRLDRPNPYLKNLLMPSEIRVRRKLKHPSRKILDVRVVPGVQTSNFTKPFVEIAVAGGVLTQIRLHKQKRRPVRIRTGYRNWKAK